MHANAVNSADWLCWPIAMHAVGRVKQGVLSVAEYSMAMFSEEPHQSREVFLVRVDHLIEELKRVRDSLTVAGDQPGSRKLSPPAYQPAASFSHFAR
jgi:hypothetical protein